MSGDVASFEHRNQGFRLSFHRRLLTAEEVHHVVLQCRDTLHAHVVVLRAQAYCDRWQIETSFQTVKQEFALEKARVLTFRRREAQGEAVAKPVLKAIGA